MKCRLVLGWLLAATCGCASMRHTDDAWWGRDKAQHLAVSFALAAGTSYALNHDRGDREEAAAIGAASASLVGAGKEVYDRNIKRTYFSGKDLVWDMIGGILGGLAGAAIADP